MLTTIATIYASFSIAASILLLAALRLSSQISQNEELSKSVVIVEKSKKNIYSTGSLGD
jgi:hypothetical protein